MLKWSQKKRRPDVLHSQTHPLVCETCLAGAHVPSGHYCCDSWSSVEVLNTSEKNLNIYRYIYSGVLRANMHPSL